MRDREREVVAAVRQAIGHVSRRNPIPESNALLRSPLVLDYLRQHGREDATENREEAIAEILHVLASEFGEEPTTGKRDRQQQLKLFDLMYRLLQGRPSKGPTVARQTYERDHAHVVKILAGRFLQHEERLLHGLSDDHPPKQLRDARHAAQDISLWLDDHPADLDLVRLRALSESALTIEDYHYYGEAQGYFQQAQTRLQCSRQSPVMLAQGVFTTTRLAHCLMVQDEISQANASFAEAAYLAAEIDDWEGLIHSTHMRGVTYTSMGDCDTGLQCLKQAFDRASKAAFAQQRRAWIQRDMIQALMRQRAFLEIPALARASLLIRETAGDAQGSMMTWEIWGRALLVQQQYAAAEDKLNKALELSAIVPSRFFQTMLFASMAQLYGAWGKHERALAFLTEAQALAQRFGMWHELNRLDKIRRRWCADEAAV